MNLNYYFEHTELTRLVRKLELPWMLYIDNVYSAMWQFIPMYIIISFSMLLVENYGLVENWLLDE